jgi:hypothetical protein
MKLFDRLLRRSSACCHNNSTPAFSEIGHNAVRRYYWFCSRCGKKIFVNERVGETDGPPYASTATARAIFRDPTAH